VFDNLPQKLALEMLRDFATRRNSHMPEMPMMPPGRGIIVEEDIAEEDEEPRPAKSGSSGRRGAKRRSTT
jgi:hypothetical protein